VSETPPHKKFEQQVERIHQLLEVEGSTVTWNDHIPDPDNPSRPRQIDVSIRRDGALTLIECRIHKDPQDVTWIEELMGRRTSLKADAVIAVSASGFTTTAREKAAAHGIHLRDLAALSRACGAIIRFALSLRSSAILRSFFSALRSRTRFITTILSRLRMARRIDVGSRDIVGDRIDGHDNLAFRWDRRIRQGAAKRITCVLF
jgi:hypothetical protein